MKTFPIHKTDSATTFAMSSDVPSIWTNALLKGQFANTTVSGELKSFMVIESRENKSITIVEQRAEGANTTKTSPMIAQCMIESAEKRGFKIQSQYFNSKLYTIYTK